MTPPAAKCQICPNPVEDSAPEALCGPCTVELVHRVLDAEPERDYAQCAVCKADYRHTEARVIRAAKNPRAPLSRITPRLCWVCARLYHSVQVEIAAAEAAGDMPE